MSNSGIGGRESLAVLQELASQPGPPALSVSPGRAWLAILSRRSPPTLPDLARPFRMICGVPVDSAAGWPRTAFSCVGIDFVEVSSPRRLALRLENVDSFSPIGFSRRGSRLGFLTTGGSEVRLAWADGESGMVSHGSGPPVHPIIPGPAMWCGPAHTIVYRARLSEWEALWKSPTCEAIAEDVDSPRVTSSLVRGAANGFTAAWIEEVLRSQVTVLDTLTDNARPVGPPGCFRRIEPSPDGRYLLLERLTGPFVSARLLSAMPAEIEVWRLFHSADTPFVQRLSAVSDHVGQGNAPLSRSWHWHPLEQSTLVTKAICGTGHRIVARREPFNGNENELAKTEHTCVRYCWTTEGHLLTWEHDRSLNMLLLCLTSPHGARIVVWRGPLLPATGPAPQWRREGEAAVNEVTPVWNTGRSDRVVFQKDEFLYIRTGKSGGRNTGQMLERLGTLSGSRDTVYRGSTDEHEYVITMLDDEAETLLAAAESAEAPLEYRLVYRRLKRFRSLAGSPPGARKRPAMTRELVHYVGDRRRLSATLFRPAHSAAQGAAPCLVWIYPDLAGFRSVGERVGVNQHPRITELSFLPLVFSGYPVVHLPEIPLVPDRTRPEVMIEQLVCAVSNLVDGLTEYGIDRKRIAVGGHCLGGYAAALLLAKTDLFCAGVSCSGFYNLTVRPTGWRLTAQRSMADSADVYRDGSPLFCVGSIKAPLLIICGEHDEYQQYIDITMESRRMAETLAAAGGQVRLVCLSHEGHRYESRESMMTVHGEMLRWCALHVLPARTVSTKGT